MTDKCIKKILDQHHIPIKKIEISSGIAEKSAELLDSMNLGNTFAVISDTNTHNVLGKKIEENLKSIYKITSIILPDGIKPHVKHIRDLCAKTMHADAIIAVGSGTINDLCKYLSFLEDKPYVIFGTAPSMNGYASANASITIDGYKKTIPAHLPSGIFLDLDILAEAPKRLIQSGLGDSICRSTAQADWLLSHHILGTEYNSIPFEILKTYEKRLFENADKLITGNINAIEALANTLVISGIGMYISNGSYPASQGEHLIAHYMEMILAGKNTPTYHGEEIGVTTLMMAELQEKILSYDKISISPSVINEKAILNHFGKTIGASCISEMKLKKITQKKAEEINTMLAKDWDNLREEILRITIYSEILREVLLSAKCAITPENIGWAEKLSLNSMSHALYIRSRFTFMDMGQLI